MNKVSVLMSVYNTDEAYLREAIESILKQTFSDFEFIIVLDCPTDNSEAIVVEYAERDERIRILRNPKNIGLAASLNKGVSEANCKYIARMDSDDIALPNRFQVQYDYMETHDEVVVLGARVAPFGVKLQDKEAICSSWIEDQEYLKIRMMFINAGIPHPTAFIRRSVLVQNHVSYNPEYRSNEDYRLWVDLIDIGEVMMLPDVLLRYRIHPHQMTAQKGVINQWNSLISTFQAKQLLGEMTEEDEMFHVSAYETWIPNEDVAGYSKYLNRIMERNDKLCIYPKNKLINEIGLMWCQKAIRRYSIEKKKDMLLNRKFFAILRPGVLRHYLVALKKKSEYLKEVKKFENSGCFKK